MKRSVALNVANFFGEVYGLMLHAGGGIRYLEVGRSGHPGTLCTALKRNGSGGGPDKRFAAGHDARKID